MLQGCEVIRQTNFVSICLFYRTWQHKEQGYYKWMEIHHQMSHQLWWQDKEQELH